MTDISQEHSGDGHNVGGDNITIEGNYVVYQNIGRKVNRWLTNLPRLREKLIGREDDLERLAQQLEEEGSVVLMKAMGGIGKTTLAIEYTNRFKKDYAHVAFIEQGEHFGTDILNKALIKNLGLEGDITSDADENVSLVFNALNNLGGKRLLVIDDANESLVSYKKYLPTDWHILITSRQKLEFHQHQIFELDFLSPEDAKTLFYTYYERETDDELVETILQKIDYHTLTIELLAKTAQKRRNLSLSKLVETLEEKGVAIGRRAGISTFRNEGQKIDYIFTFLSAIFEIQNLSKEDEELLRQFLLWPPIFHPITNLEKLLALEKEENEDEYDQFVDSVESLKERGWLIYNPREDAYKLHAVLQDVLQTKLKIEDSRLQWMIIQIAHLLYLDETKDNPVHKYQWIQFGYKILSRIPDGSNLDKSYLELKLGYLLQHLGLYETAKELFESAYQYQLNSPGKELEDIDLARSHLGLIYQKLGQLRPAQELLKEALDSYIRELGDSHPYVATTQSNLATVLQDLGQLKPAQELLQKALQSAIQNFGENHPTVAIRQSNLALVLQDRGQLEHAEELLQKALQNELQNFGENHPTVATTQSNLAIVYKNMGDLEMAKVLSAKAIEIWQATLGADHPSTVYEKEWLANLEEE